jgi:hypothetical protein
LRGFFHCLRRFSWHNFCVFYWWLFWLWRCFFNSSDWLLRARLRCSWLRRNRLCCDWFCCNIRRRGNFNFRWGDWDIFYGLILDGWRGFAFLWWGRLCYWRGSRRAKLVCGFFDYA